MARAREKKVAYYEGRPTGSGGNGERNAKKKKKGEVYLARNLRQELRTRQP